MKQVMTVKQQIERYSLSPKGRQRRKDEIYQMIAGNYGLFTIAFFNHKGTKQQKDKLRYIRKVVFS